MSREAKPQRKRRLFALATFLVVLGTASDAAAEPVLRPALDGLLVFDQGELAGGGALGFWAGYDLELEPIVLVPELGGSFALYGGGFDGYATRALGGMRAGIAASVEPTLLVRAGYGNAVLTRGDASLLKHGFALQAGIALDKRLSRDFTLGGELYYDGFFTSEQGYGTAQHALAGGLTFGFWL